MCKLGTVIAIRGGMNVMTKERKKNSTKLKSHTETKKATEKIDESHIIEYLKSVVVKISDLKKIEKHVRPNITNNHYKDFESVAKNINLVCEAFKYSKNVTGKINLLEAIYKFESIFHSDITIAIIKINDNIYYSNIHVYVPISEESYQYIKDELINMNKKIEEKEKKKVLDFSLNSLNYESFVKNDRIAGNLLLPIYISGKKLGTLVFYYLDYRRSRGRD